MPWSQTFTFLGNNVAPTNTLNVRNFTSGYSVVLVVHKVVSNSCNETFPYRYIPPKFLAHGPHSSLTPQTFFIIRSPDSNQFYQSTGAGN